MPEVTAQENEELQSGSLHPLLLAYFNLFLLICLFVREDLIM